MERGNKFLKLNCLKFNNILNNTSCNFNTSWSFMGYKAWLTTDSHQALALYLFTSQEKCKKIGLNSSGDQNTVAQNYAVQGPYTNHMKFKVTGSTKTRLIVVRKERFFFYSLIISKFL